MSRTRIIPEDEEGRE